jgi:hypothetical protein
VRVAFDASLVPGAASHLNAYRGALARPFAAFEPVPGGCRVASSVIDDAGATAGGSWCFLVAAACEAPGGPVSEGTLGSDSTVARRASPSPACP